MVVTWPTGFTARELLFSRTDEQKAPGQHVHFTGGKTGGCWSCNCQFKQGFHQLEIDFFCCCFKEILVPHSALDKSKWAASHGK